jgi:hypothetical protein
MIRALKMMIRDEALALKLTSDLQQRLFHVLQAEHLDVGFMLSGFRRRHKVSQRPLRVLERLPRRERRVSKGAPERERLGTNSATCASPRTGASWRRCAWSARTSARSMKSRLNSP